MKRSDLKFHETFQPDSSYISKILELAAEIYSGSKMDISNLTGIPTGKLKGKVEPCIRYAAFMDLIEYAIDNGRYQLELTSIGREVFSQDQFLHEPLTRWICHYGITAYPTGAPQWQFIVNSMDLQFNSAVSSEHIAKTANRTWDLDLQFSELFGVVRSSYADGFFEGLKYVSWDDYLKFNEHNASIDMVYVYAYAMLRQWERIRPEAIELTEREVFEELKFCNVFGMNENEAKKAFDMMESADLLKVNRQLFPATCIRVTNSELVIPRLYDNLL